ncbi:hypothetical protein WBJ53_27410 [Spirosoma sp. SC4-14]|uniref:hypothetical protein n=1 Tax=Spirosoma sp. SC4-14 TaxID=3128900 RepID=UPI0030D2E0FB
MSIKNYQPHLQRACLEQTLTQWVEAMKRFDTNHKRIVLFIRSFQAASQHANVYTGLCSVNDLNQLLVKMQHELEKLQAEMLQVNQVQPIALMTEYQLLSRHVSTLNELNLLAEASLSLAAFSAS